MNLQTRKSIRVWARRMPWLTLAVSAVIAAFTYAGIGFVGVSPVWLVALLMGFMVMSANSEIGALRPYGQDTSLWPLLAVFGHVALLAPLAFDSAMSNGLPEEQALPLLMSMLLMFVIAAAMMLVLQALVIPVYEAEKRDAALKQLEAEVAALAMYGELPNTFNKLITLLRSQGGTMPLDELTSHVQSLSDYRKTTSLMSHEPST